ncbi:PAS domain S-box protein, partial [Acinetobacter baumannii]
HRGVVIGFNPAAEKLFGYRADQVEGQNIAVLMTGDDAARHDELIRRYHDSGRPSPVGQLRELHGRCADGTVFPLEIALSSWRNDGQ